MLNDEKLLDKGVLNIGIGPLPPIYQPPKNPTKAIPPVKRKDPVKNPASDKK